mmetsp:Transcript_4617/g.10138  ORF Transcript_4617/g.10138 Transcript_4617/m.10138 type:complete len:221 (-) Transcript_4617:380-1042(-)
MGQLEQRRRRAHAQGVRHAGGGHRHRGGQLNLCHGDAAGRRLAADPGPRGDRPAHGPHVHEQAHALDRAAHRPLRRLHRARRLVARTAPQDRARRRADGGATGPLDHLRPFRHDDGALDDGQAGRCAAPRRASRRRRDRAAGSRRRRHVRPRHVSLVPATPQHLPLRRAGALHRLHRLRHAAHDRRLRDGRGRPLEARCRPLHQLQGHLHSRPLPPHGTL